MTRFVDPDSLPDLEAWRATVERDLRGAPFDERLVTRLYEGIDVQPLYAGEARDPGPVGGPDYRRGVSTSERWQVRQRVDVAAPEDARAAIADDLEHGVDAIQILFDRATRLGTDGDDMGDDGLSVASGYELARVLGEVDLASTTLHLDAGARGPEALALLLAVAARSRVDARQLTGFLAHDPLTAALRDGRLPGSFDDAWDDAAALAAWTEAHAPAVRPLQIGATVVHEAGGHAVHEIAFALASTAELLRRLDARGVSAPAVARRCAAEVAISPDLFLEIAKLRALRHTWSRLMDACGVSTDDRALHIHAVTSRRALAAVDPWTNMLRVSTQAFAAVAGGATSIATRPFDALAGVPSALGRRIARNSQLILRDESLLGSVHDPAGGSWYVETLTDELAKRAWALFQDIERRGGLQACVLDGGLQRWVGDVREARRRDVASRRLPVTGVSAYALPNETPLDNPPRRPAGFAERRAASLAAEGRGPDVAAKLAALSAASDPASRLAAVIEAVAAGATLTALARTEARTPRKVEPLPATRDAEPFETVRARVEASGHAGAVSVIALGSLAEINARTAWALTALGAGGFEAPEWSPTDDLDAAFSGFVPRGIALVCIPDTRMGTDLLPALRRARAAGAATVVVAGHPRKAPDGADPDHWLHLGGDLLSVLDALASTLEALA